MKKYLFGGLFVLQLINSEVLSWIVLAAAAWIFLVKVFPDLMEGSK